ncbi:hypothetical protein [Kaistella faecalis]|uniref:hypothetical protein n=1 Tax=Kaistella faecalis TaxID=2852098 RepID=UPI001C447F78|nr:hypothetical protein [Chryseobacterium faecale]UFK98825.1 hypothetical protein LL667_05600 [Chryseobacterium faecale]
MLDYIKFEIKNTDLINRIWSHSDLVYKSEHSFVNKNTGEIRTVDNRQFVNLILSKHPNKLEVSGSLHKLFNNGLHNANDFTVSDCIRTLENLITRFGLVPDDCYINNLEFGVNFETPGNVSEVVKWLRFHNKNQFIKYPDLAECYFAGTSYFGVKAYNKTLNFPDYAQPNLMRFEGKTRQSKYLLSKGIKTLSDLLKPTTYSLLSKVLISEWNNVLIFDKRSKKGKRFCNTDFWLEILENNHRNTFVNTKKKYYKILGEKGLQNLIYKRISDKLDQLKLCAVSTISATVTPEHTKPQTAPISTKTLVQFPPIVKMESNTPTHRETLRVCEVTSLNISMQKPNSKYLCFAGLKYYSETEPETYQRLKEKYLTPKKWSLDLPDQFYYIAHNVRNEFFNEIHNRKRFEQRNYPKHQLQFSFC